MDVREKVVELLHKGVRCPGVIDNCNDCPYYSFEKACDEFGATVDLLIANGVTVQECKLGDKIYQADDVRIYESTISEITLTAKHTIFVTENITFDERAIGNSVFLSYAEAEAHLPQPPKGE